MCFRTTLRSNAFWASSWRWAASTFHGVYWNSSRQKWSSKSSRQNASKFIGTFEDEVTAAKAHDEYLRQEIPATQTLVRYLNFPTPAEVQLHASLKKESGPYSVGGEYTQSQIKEDEAITLIQETFLCAVTSKYEVQRLGEGTRADIAVRRQSLMTQDSWLRVQVKSTRCKANGSYNFLVMQGYHAMLLLCVALEDELLWSFPSGVALPKHIALTVGGKWDAYRCSDLEQMLDHAWENAEVYVRCSYEEADTPVSRSHQVERRSQVVGQRLFWAAGLSVKRPKTLQRQVDMMVNNYRVQDKTVVRYATTCKFYVRLSKSLAGKRVAYHMSDFDILVCYVWLGRKPMGMFLFPMQLLISRGLVSTPDDTQGRRAILLYPPWKKNHNRARHEWQLPYYLDISDVESVHGELPHEIRTHLEQCFSNRSKKE